MYTIAASAHFVGTCASAGAAEALDVAGCFELDLGVNKPSSPPSHRLELEDFRVDGGR